MENVTWFHCSAGDQPAVSPAGAVAGGLPLAGGDQPAVSPAGVSLGVCLWQGDTSLRCPPRGCRWRSASGWCPPRGLSLGVCLWQGETSLRCPPRGCRWGSASGWCPPRGLSLGVCLWQVETSLQCPLRGCRRGSAPGRWCWVATPLLVLFTTFSCKCGALCSETYVESQIKPLN